MSHIVLHITDLDENYLICYSKKESFEGKIPSGPEIEDCFQAYIDALPSNSTKTWDDMINDVMSSFDGINYEIASDIYTVRV